MLGLSFSPLTLSLLLELAPRKLEPWFIQYSFFLQRLPCISINLPYNLAWNTVVIFGLSLLPATWNCLISYKNGYAGLLVLHVPPASPKPLAHRANVVSLSLFYRHYFGRYSSGSTGSTSLFLKEIYLLFQ